jgi:hypothetical protein
VNRRIGGFHQDSFGQWMAELECGHSQRLRHAPPWVNRKWVTTLQGRTAALGVPLYCRRCSQDQRLARAIKDLSVSRIVYRTDLTRTDSLVIPLGVMAEITMEGLRGLGIVARTELLSHEAERVSRLIRSVLEHPFEYLKKEFDWAITRTEPGKALQSLASRHIASFLFQPPTSHLLRDVTDAAVPPTKLLETLRIARDHEFELLLAETHGEVRRTLPVSALEQLAA